MGDRGRSRAPPAHHPRPAGPLHPWAPVRRTGQLPRARTRSCAATEPHARKLRDITGESAQLYHQQGDQQGLRCRGGALDQDCGTPFLWGSALTMATGSARSLLLAWEDPERLHRGLMGAEFARDHLSGVHLVAGGKSCRGRGSRVSLRYGRMGFTGMATTSSPAVWVCRTIERLSRRPGHLHAPAVLAAGREARPESLRRTG